jgi:hypothetical protein
MTVILDVRESPSDRHHPQNHYLLSSLSYEWIGEYYGTSW